MIALLALTYFAFCFFAGNSDASEGVTDRVSNIWPEYTGFWIYLVGLKVGSIITNRERIKIARPLLSQNSPSEVGQLKCVTIHTLFGDSFATCQ